MTAPRRTSPRYVRFVATGAGLGLLIALVVVLVRASAVERPAVLFFYLGMLLTGTGALLGGLVAVLITGRDP